MVSELPYIKSESGEWIVTTLEDPPPTTSRVATDMTYEQMDFQLNGPHFFEGLVGDTVELASNAAESLRGRNRLPNPEESAPPNIRSRAALAFSMIMPFFLA